MKGVKILVDFDGTCVYHKYPGVGKDLPGAVDVLKELVDAGCKLILFTIRSNSDNGLADAIDWFKERDIELYGIQSDPAQQAWTSSPKAYGHLIIDDTALGAPTKLDLKKSNRYFIDWVEVRKLFVELAILEELPDLEN